MAHANYTLWPSVSSTESVSSLTVNVNVRILAANLL
jgi:hypothetical protein